MPTRMSPGIYKKMLVRIPPDVIEALHEESEFEDISVNAKIVQALREWVKGKRKAHAAQQTTEPIATTP